MRMRESFQGRQRENADASLKLAAELESLTRELEMSPLRSSFTILPDSR